MTFQEKVDYDVIIVGGGPGGLFGAEKLAKAGKSVLVVDRKQELGAPVRCGEGLGLGWFKRLDIPVDTSYCIQEMYGACLYSPKGKKVEIRFPDVSGYIIERKMFEKYLGAEAARAGAKIELKTECLDLIKEDGFVKGVKLRKYDEDYELRAHVVIAADGVESTVARMAGMQTFIKLDDIDSGFQYEMAGIEYENPDLINLFFGNEISPRGYVWIFPKGKDVANVGIGIHGADAKTAKQYLDEWIETQPGIKKGTILEVNGGGIPVGGFFEKITTNGLMIVGDAAHQVNPMHGGGMGLAMEAAKIAAEVACKSIDAKDVSNEALDEYNKTWWEQRGGQLKKILIRRKMFEELNDDHFETLANAFDGDEIMKLNYASLPEAAALAGKKLIMHPKLLAILLKYLAPRKAD